jgi:hypothetical protein
VRRAKNPFAFGASLSFAALSKAFCWCNNYRQFFRFAGIGDGVRGMGGIRWVRSPMRFGHIPIGRHSSWWEKGRRRNVGSSSVSLPRLVDGFATNHWPDYQRSSGNTALI